MRCSSRSVGVFHWLMFVVLVISSFTPHLFATSEQDYLPLREGDEWTMDVTIVAPNGQKFTATGRRRVGEQIERDGKTYHQVRTWIEDGPFPFDQVKLMRKAATGVYSLDPQWKGQKEQLEIVLPLKVGQTWKRVNGPQNLNERVVALESVTVGEKIFENCYRVRSESSDGQFTEDYWEAPILGSIKSDITSFGSRIRLTLREFKPGKP